MTRTLTIQLEDNSNEGDSHDDEQVVERVLELVKDGYTSGYDPRWYIEEKDDQTDKIESAAPELLASLIRAVAYLDANRPKGKMKDIFSKLNEHENDVLKPARAAIAKATT
jgi:hypothetical protein